MSAVLREWPEIETVLFYWAHSGAAWWGRSAPLPSNINGLLVAFADGTLAAVDGLRESGGRVHVPMVIDGFEMSYNMHAFEDFSSAVSLIRSGWKLSAVPAAFNRTMRAGLGFCFDCTPDVSGPLPPPSLGQKHLWFSEAENLHRNNFPPATFSDVLTSMLKRSCTQAWNLERLASSMLAPMLQTKLQTSSARASANSGVWSLA